MAVAALGGERPDFSGEWKMNVAKSEFGANYRAPAKQVNTIEHQDPKLKVTQDEEFTSEPARVHGSVEYTTDGRECENTVMGNKVTATLHWEGEILVVVSKSEWGGSAFTLTDRWSLADDKKTLTVKRRFENAHMKADQTLVFEKP